MTGSLLDKADLSAYKQSHNIHLQGSCTQFLINRCEDLRRNVQRTNTVQLFPKDIRPRQGRAAQDYHGYHNQYNVLSTTILILGHLGTPATLNSVSQQGY
jgi:hypothetical protein